MSRLFSTFALRELVFRNRVFVSPMCQYSAKDGSPDDWHLVHLGTRAVGGAGLVMMEATAVLPEGRISPGDTGIWSDDQIEAYRRIATFVKSQGASPAIQLAHAGRKASCKVMWEGGEPLTAEEGAWQTVGPSAIPFDKGQPAPREMTQQDINTVVQAWGDAARRSLAAGFEVVEVHMAHGYLMHEFLSPISNRRTDEYGGSLQNRMRLPLRVAAKVREIWPAKWPVFVRISGTDWVEGGWDVPQSVLLAKEFKRVGIDLVDCSSGGMTPDAKIPAAPGFQAPIARTIREQAGIATGAVGMITRPEQAEQIIADGSADVVLLGRELLRNPYWPMQAADVLGADVRWPNQYSRAKA